MSLKKDARPQSVVPSIARDDRDAEKEATALAMAARDIKAGHAPAPLSHSEWDEIRSARVSPSV